MSETELCENCNEVFKDNHNWQGKCNKPYPGYGVSFWSPVAPKPQEERSETESDWKPMIEAIEGDGFFVVRHISSGIVANKINEHAALDALLNMLRRVEEFKQKHVVRSAALHESTPKEK